MLQDIRDKSQTWIAKLIIGVIVLLMALYGFDAIVRNWSSEPAALTINGQDISQATVARTMEIQKRQLEQRLGPNADVIDDALMRETTLNALIDQQLLLQAAKRDHLSMPTELLDQLIVNTPAFQVQGKFNPQRFDQVLSELGYSRPQFRDLLKDDALLGQLRAGIASTSFIGDADVLAFARLERQSRTAEQLSLKAEPAAVQLSDADIQGYFQAHQAQFESPEQVNLDYVVLDRDAFLDQVKISDADITKAYEAEVARLPEQRHPAHILVAVDDTLSDADARKKIDDLAARLAKGEDFAQLARENSADIASAQKGGDLGFVASGALDPEFDKALADLQPGQVSAPVRTPYGWHLIKLLEVRAVERPTLAAERPKLLRQLQTAGADQLYAAARNRLETLAYESADLKQPAEELKLNIQSANGVMHVGSEGLWANPAVVSAVFDPDVLDNGANSKLVEVSPERALVAHVREHQAARPLTLDEARPSIVEQLTAQRAREALQKRGDDLLAALRQNPAASLPGGLKWGEKRSITREQEGVEHSVAQTLFSMPAPKDDHPTFAGTTLASVST